MQEREGEHKSKDLQQVRGVSAQMELLAQNKRTENSQWGSDTYKILGFVVEK